MKTLFIHIGLSLHVTNTVATASALQSVDCICVSNLWVHLTVVPLCLAGCLSLAAGLSMFPFPFPLLSKNKQTDGNKIT